MNQFKRCSVVMLPTNQKAIIHWNEDNHFFLSNTPKLINSGFELFITSDEEIKDGDWFYYEAEKTIMQCTEHNFYFTPELIQNYSNVYKIIVTTDTSLKIKTFYEIESNQEISLPRPSQQFIEKYIEEYNKGNVITDVLVEYEEMTGDELGCDPAYYPLKERLKLKVNPKDNTITIKKVKDSYSREEVRKLCIDAFISGTVARNKIGTVKDSEIELKNMNIWLAENL